MKRVFAYILVVLCVLQSLGYAKPKKAEKKTCTLRIRYWDSEERSYLTPMYEIYAASSPGTVCVKQARKKRQTSQCVLEKTVGVTSTEEPEKKVQMALSFDQRLKSFVRLKAGSYKLDFSSLSISASSAKYIGPARVVRVVVDKDDTMLVLNVEMTKMIFVAFVNEVDSGSLILTGSSGDTEIKANSNRKIRPGRYTFGYKPRASSIRECNVYGFMPEKGFDRPKCPEDGKDLQIKYQPAGDAFRMIVKPITPIAPSVTVQICPYEEECEIYDLGQSVDLESSVYKIIIQTDRASH